MPTRKKAPQTRKGSGRTAKISRKATVRVKGGVVPPYGAAIRQAIARGDVQEMKDLAATTRKWLSEAGSALDELENFVKRSGA